MSEERFPVGKLLIYLQEKKSLWFIIAALLIGIALMLFGADTEKFSESNIEHKLGSFCEQIDGVSEVSVIVTLDKDENINGIAVVCENGDTPAIQLKLTRLLCSLFGLPSDSVSIIGRSR